MLWVLKRTVSMRQVLKRTVSMRRVPLNIQNTLVTDKLVPKSTRTHFWSTHTLVNWYLSQLVP